MIEPTGTVEEWEAEADRIRGRIAGMDREIAALAAFKARELETLATVEDTLSGLRLARLFAHMRPTKEPTP